jgi:hypothetical protein
VRIEFEESIDHVMASRDARQKVVRDDADRDRLIDGFPLNDADRRRLIDGLPVETTQPI